MIAAEPIERILLMMLKVPPDVVLCKGQRRRHGVGEASAKMLIQIFIDPRLDSLESMLVGVLV